MNGAGGADPRRRRGPARAGQGGKGEAKRSVDGIERVRGLGGRKISSLFSPTFT